MNDHGAAGLPGLLNVSTGSDGRESRAARGVARSVSEPEQFGVVFSDYFAEIHGYVARRLGPDAADDIAAATFETAFFKRLHFDPDVGTVRAWLYGIATRHVSRYRRDEARRYRAMARIPALVPAAGPEDSVTSRVAARTELRNLAGLLADMSDGDRDVLLLVALADLSLAEVGFALGIPYGTVGSRLHRARRIIREGAGLARRGEPGSDDQADPRKTSMTSMPIAEG
jgi:RNA polymerase sigma factor (sigma-70 family)